MNELDFGCRCPGADSRYVECENRATQEDGLCDNCRERDCPNTPLAWYMKAIDTAFEENTYNLERDGIMAEYLRRCEEAGDQP